MDQDILDYIYNSVGDRNIKFIDISLLVCLIKKCTSSDSYKFKINRGRMAKYIDVTPKTMDKCFERLDLSGCISYKKKRGRYGGILVYLEFADDYDLLEDDDTEDSDDAQKEEESQDLPDKVTPINSTYKKSKEFPADKEQIRKLIKSEYPNDVFHEYEETVHGVKTNIVDEIKDWLEYKRDVRNEPVSRISLIKLIGRLHTMEKPAYEISNSIEKNWKNVNIEGEFGGNGSANEDDEYWEARRNGIRESKYEFI